MIRAILTDVDGVLTDSTYFVLPDGERIKRFNTRDFVGLKNAHNAGFAVGIFTGDTGASCVPEQISRAAPFAYLEEGVKDKRVAAELFVNSMGLQLENVAFVGDDLNDIGLLEVVGFAACPLDAVGEVTELIHKRTESQLGSALTIPLRGGEGCVRYLCDFILSSSFKAIT